MKSRKMKQTTFFLITLLIYFFQYSDASHYRGGYITWKPVDNMTQIEITYRISWRSSYSSNHHCDSNTIADDDINDGEGNLICRTCSPQETIGRMNYKCTDFSEVDDWTTGINSILFDYGSRTEFYIGYSSSAWISLQYGGSAWSVMTLVKTSVRNDTQIRNTSPITSMQPITRLSLNCKYQIKIPVNDIDGDFIRCRWAESSIYPVNECGGVCDALPGSNLTEETCELHYTANEAGYFAVAIQIEDFISSSSTTPLSSVPLQFLLLVSGDSNTCASGPTFSDATIRDKAILYISSEVLFSLQIIASSGSDTTSVREIITVSPVNMTKTALQETGLHWSINVSWIPTSNQAGDHLFCFSAIDVNGLSTEQRCITLIVDGDKTETETTDSTTTPAMTTWDDTIIETTYPTKTTVITTWEPTFNLGTQILDSTTGTMASTPGLTEIETTDPTRTTVLTTSGLTEIELTDPITTTILTTLEETETGTPYPTRNTVISTCM